MKKRIILFGYFLVVFLMIIIPNINAIKQKTIEKSFELKIITKINNLNYDVFEINISEIKSLTKKKINFNDILLSQIYYDFKVIKQKDGIVCYELERLLYNFLKLVDFSAMYHLMGLAVICLIIANEIYNLAITLNCDWVNNSHVTNW